MNVMLDDGAKMPTRAHEEDAGYDLYSRETKLVTAKGNAKFDTGVHIALPFYEVNRSRKLRTVGFIKSKSGLNVKHDLTTDGVIDMGYTGSIAVKLYNNGNTDYLVKKGDKIAQLVILPCITMPLVETDRLDETERGNNGFGSTGY